MSKQFKSSESLKLGKLKPDRLEKFSAYAKNRNSEDIRSSKKLNSSGPKMNSSKNGSIGLRSRDSTRLLSKPKGGLEFSGRRKLRCKRGFSKNSKEKNRRCLLPRGGPSLTGRSRSRKKLNVRIPTY